MMSSWQETDAAVTEKGRGRVLARSGARRNA
jgi:hypothetical protein